MANQVREEVNLGNALTRRYRLRKARGGDGDFFEVTVPKEIVEREARKLGLTLDEFQQRYELECLYDSFEGVHYRFVTRNGE